jgi:hypothetical protein
MTKRGLATSAFLVALLLSGAASAQQQFVSQPDSPQWLKDRSYNEGAGVRTGDLELHPGIAGEVGYDSNWFLRTNNNGPAPAGYLNGPPNAPVVPALEFRVTPSLYLSTIGPQRRATDLTAQPPSVAFRAGINATYREFVGLANTSAPAGATNNPNDISQQRNIGGSADARLDILPERPLGAAIYASYARVIQPNQGTADPNLSFNRDDINAGGEIVTQPGSGTLDWRFGYQFHDTIFEQSAGQPFNSLTNEGYTRGRWKFRPLTALIYDASLKFISYQNSGQALATEGLVNSTPVRARIGMNGLVTQRLAFLGLVGWGASFYDQGTLSNQPQYDSVIGQAELKWFLSAGPGVANPSDVSLALSSIALGYTRDFQNSLLGNYYGMDRGYLRFNYFFAGRALVTIEGGVAAIEYPTILWGTTANGVAANTVRANSFTDMRADATLFSEYRFTDAFGINATLRYTANISNTQIQEVQGGTNQTLFDMSWNRFEAFLGVRYFL